jgi:hypothetical protein
MTYMLAGPFATRELANLWRVAKRRLGWVARHVRWLPLGPHGPGWYVDYAGEVLGRVGRRNDYLRPTGGRTTLLEATFEARVVADAVASIERSRQCDAPMPREMPEAVRAAFEGAKKEKSC